MVAAEQAVVVEIRETISIEEIKGYIGNKNGGNQSSLKVCCSGLCKNLHKLGKCQWKQKDKET